MAILKCKMCGGDIEVSADNTYGTCEYCGSTMTLPKIGDEQRANLYNRANHIRRQNEFDKALGVYERIIDEDDTQAEAHWGAVLCRFGIEYVEDPASHERIPTCHRASYDSILNDVDYLAALKYTTDSYTKSLYEKEAKYIAEVQKNILSISQKENPYDVFICYKESDESGSRTKDSALAQDVYYQLTNEGFKVFFSRITLEDKLGQAYEPYIFAALNSAKVMVVIGTKSEYFNAVWVKNEWSRYLNIMKKDKSRLLIPCYQGMDAYDLPEEMSMLQSQDMGKIGFIQDLVRGIKKVLDTDKKPSESQSASTPVAPGVESLLKRAELFLEDKDWSRAREYFDKVLDIDPECAAAYAGKFCVEQKYCKLEQMAKDAELFAKVDADQRIRQMCRSGQKFQAIKDIRARTGLDLKEAMAYVDKLVASAGQEKPGQIASGDYQKAMRFADNAMKEQLHRYEESAKALAKEKSRKVDYDYACEKQHDTLTIEQVEEIAALFESLLDYADSAERAKNCHQRAEKMRHKELEEKYTELLSRVERALQPDTFLSLSKEFAELGDYKDAKQRSTFCKERAQQRTEEIAKEKFDKAVAAQAEAKSADDFSRAAELFEAVKYNDSTKRAEICRAKSEETKRVEEAERERRRIADEKLEKQRKEKNKKIAIIAVSVIALAVAAVLFLTQVIIPNSKYNNAVALVEAGSYEEAISVFEALGDYKDSAIMIKNCNLGIKENEHNAKLAKYQEEKDSLLEQYEKEKAQLVSGNSKKAAGELYEIWKQLWSLEKSVSDVYDEPDSDSTASPSNSSPEMLEIVDLLNDHVSKMESEGNTQDALDTIEVLLLMAEGTPTKALIYRKAEVLFNGERYDEAMDVFISLGDYEDSRLRIKDCEKGKDYLTAEDYLAAGDKQEAIDRFCSVGSFKDAEQRVMDMVSEEDGGKLLTMDGVYFVRDTKNRITDYYICIEKGKITCFQRDAYNEGNFISTNDALANYETYLDENDDLKQSIVSWDYKNGCYRLNSNRFSILSANSISVSTDYGYDTKKGTYNKIG